MQAYSPVVVFLRKSLLKQDFCARSPVLFMPMWCNGEQDFCVAVSVF